jgi:uncharacterized integral membrane protein
VILIYLLMAVVGALAVVFAVQNPTSVAVRFLVWETRGMPLSLVILLSAVTGLVLASVAALIREIRLRLRIRQLEARVATLQAAAPAAGPPPAIARREESAPPPASPPPAGPARPPRP